MPDSWYVVASHAQQMPHATDVEWCSSSLYGSRHSADLLLQRKYTASWQASVQGGRVRGRAEGCHRDLEAHGARRAVRTRWPAHARHAADAWRTGASHRGARLRALTCATHVRRTYTCWLQRCRAQSALSAAPLTLPCTRARRVACHARHSCRMPRGRSFS